MHPLKPEVWLVHRLPMRGKGAGFGLVSRIPELQSMENEIDRKVAPCGMVARKGSVGRGGAGNYDGRHGTQGSLGRVEHGKDRRGEGDSRHAIGETLRSYGDRLARRGAGAEGG